MNIARRLFSRLADLQDVTTYDLPTNNGPLATALAGAGSTAQTWAGNNPNIPETLVVSAISGNETIDGLELTRRADENGRPAWGDVTLTYVRWDAGDWKAFASTSPADEFIADETSDALTPVGITFDSPTTGSGSITFTGEIPTGTYLGQLLQAADGSWWRWDGSAWEEDSEASHALSTFDIYGSGEPGDINTAYASFTHSSGGDLTISTEQTGTGTAGDVIFPGTVKASQFVATSVTALEFSDGSLLYKSNLAINLRLQTQSTFEIQGTSGAAASAHGIVWRSTAGIFTSSGKLAVRNSDNSADYPLTCANLTASGTVQTGTYTFANLPAATTAGLRAFCSDSDTAAAGNFASTFAGGGANFVPCYSDGTNWRIG